LRIAARFFDRSAETKIFKRGIDAYNNPSFYRQLGKDPDQLVAAALELLARKFSLQPHCSDVHRDLGKDVARAWLKRRVANVVGLQRTLMLI
jgi:hypothetical protein